MNRSRRYNKPFVSGGVFNPNDALKPGVQPQQQQPQQQQPAPPPQVQAPEIVKIELPPTQPEPSFDNEMADGVTEENGKKIQFKKIFQKRKKSSERAREKKIRQNRQLRKAMLPKNALMALNEVKGVVISDFIISSNAGGGFTAIVTVNDSQYEGKGSSKMAAKTNACEKALRDYIIAKMTPRFRKFTPQQEIESMDITEDGQSDTNSVSDAAEDDLPMINLASFAIFKLFSEWEKDGFFVPEMHPNPQQMLDCEKGVAAPLAPKEPKKLPIRTDLPTNWQEMHPATLLCMMRPGINYVDHGSIGEKPNVVQRLGVFVDDQEFVAEGRSKKIARRNVAVQVCNTLFGTNFKTDDV